jgi:hypothetical protein
MKPDQGPDLEPRSSSPRPRLSWWGNPWVRLCALLACLTIAVLALVDVRGGLLEFAGGSSQARGAGFAPGCPGRDAPNVIRVSAAQLSALHRELSVIVAPRVGRPYAAGTIATDNLWSDNQPQRLPASGTSSAPAAYEVRWWALDRNGSEDDVAADVLEFASEREAADALTRAASPRCRQGAAAQPARLPARAINLSWVNPDQAPEWDVLFVRGRRLYRVVDVPPGYLVTATGMHQRELERRRAALTADVLACALPDARCGPTAIAGPTSLATLAGPYTGARARRAPTTAQARAYASAVNLRSDELPGARQIAPEGAAGNGGDWHAFSRCTGELRSLHLVDAVHSPIFRYRGRSQYELVYSIVSVLPSEALATRYIAVVSSERARACITSRYDRWLARLTGTRKGPQASRFTVTPLPNAAPTRYRGPGPYRGAGLRLAMDASYTTRRGRRRHLPVYFEGWAFAYGRAVVELATFTLLRPFPPANEQYLLSDLVGRAETNRL